MCEWGTFCSVHPNRETIKVTTTAVKMPKEAGFDI
jgi:hypothetical protein